VLRKEAYIAHLAPPESVFNVFCALSRIFRYVADDRVDAARTEWVTELYLFEDCSHTPLYENVPAFNEKTLAFLSKHVG